MNRRHVAVALVALWLTTAADTSLGFSYSLNGGANPREVADLLPGAQLPGGEEVTKKLAEAGKTVLRKSPKSAEKPSGENKPVVLKDIYPFLKKHCVRCHNDVAGEAKSSLTEYQDEKSILRDRELWDDVVKLVKGKAMPPANCPPVPPKDLERFLDNVNRVRQR